MIKITEHPLNPDDITSTVFSNEAGAVNVFIGTVRATTQDKKVVRLEFETYLNMAIKEIEKIIEAMKNKWPVHHVVVHHRIGTLTVGEIAVVIAVSSPHRKEAFAACQYAIDTLKETVPIWKKEIFEDGEVWVSAHP
ncbi:molybdenum cofactor biosynthesis protein MoaE [Fulvivirga kasyanovii]|uniref:Molybdopterin synthase catalytic subunit n=1 Tax=Fulvivirga kasyanovii TaxID=396812 RepID=A0ABW9RQJ7_9BACT|nr:molybdenum cofactor biosynthesis protein MoaE [Fulvivirga kasyanovii]MTI26438.1 molybdenum cofactor biosynthesis protein MoaE [Fulvivirga kasyanovii]